MSEDRNQPQLPPAPDMAHGPAEGAAENRLPPPVFRRLPGETAKAWEGFCIYVELGPNRSIRRVAERLNKSETVVAEWSGKYDWVERATAVDEAVARARHEERVKAERTEERKRVHRLGKLNRSNYDIGRRLRHRALQMLDWPIDEVEKEETSITEDGQILRQVVIRRPVKWTFRDMMVAAELSDKLMKLGLGVIDSGGRPVSGGGDTHLNLTVNVGAAGQPVHKRIEAARVHLQTNLLPERERFVDRLASAEPERPRRELEAYVDQKLLEWTAEDFHIKVEQLLDGEDGGDPLDTAIDITPESVK
jgi:hypothetical protein